jgi:tetratricopeptide (TPR) repeat protein
MTHLLPIALNPLLPRRWFRQGLPLLACCALAPILCAQEPASLPEAEDRVASVGQFPVRIVGGRLVAPVELSTVHSRVPVNLFIDFDSPGGLSLHQGIAKSLKTNDEFGRSTPITIHFPDFDVTVDRGEKGPESEYEQFTRLHSAEINEVALAGSIGAGILKDYRVTFNLPEGNIVLEKSMGQERVPENHGDEGKSGGEELEVAITSTGDLVWLPIQLGDGTVHAMAISTRHYDSLIDRDWCAKQGFPAGDVDPLKLGELNLAGFVAFRPSDLVDTNPDHGIGMIGLNLLKHLRLTLDLGAKTAICRAVVPPDSLVADREYFKALAAGDDEKLEAWLEKYPKERLSGEAARDLLARRLSAKADPGKVESAVRRLRLTWTDDSVSSEALSLTKILLKGGYPAQAVLAGELGIEGGRLDRYPNSVHKLHATLGAILLEQGEDQRAWRHLLSAAFGIPDDGSVNLNLGRYYEKQERYNRALSRYLQALLQAETGEAALQGIARVKQKMGDTQPLSVDTIAPLIAGKTLNYSAATRYRPEPAEETNRVALVEFFTNAHYKIPGKEEGAIGGVLGNEGIMTHFPREKVAMLTYHISHPELPFDSLANEFSEATAQFYRAPPAIHLVNGIAKFPGSGRAEGAEEIFKEGRDLLRESLRKKSPYQLEMNASVENGNIAGTLQITRLGDESLSGSPPTVQIVLAERGVLYPSESKVVIQRMVARAALTDNPRGLPLEINDGRMTLPFSRSLEAIVRSNTEHIRKHGAGKAHLFAAAMDPRQLTIVAFIRDGSSMEILQSIQVNPTE